MYERDASTIATRNLHRAPTDRPTDVLLTIFNYSFCYELMKLTDGYLEHFRVEQEQEEAVAALHQGAPGQMIHRPGSALPSPA